MGELNNSKHAHDIFDQIDWSLDHVSNREILVPTDLCRLINYIHPQQKN